MIQLRFCYDIPLLVSNFLMVLLPVSDRWGEKARMVGHIPLAVT